MYLRFDPNKRVSMINQGDICHVDLGPKPEDDTLPMTYDENPINILRGFRYCIILSVINNMYVVVLPLTTSQTYQHGGFSFQINNDGKISYPRFDMVLPVPVGNLSLKEYNLIESFGQKTFEGLLNEYFKRIRNSTGRASYNPVISGRIENERLRNQMAAKALATAASEEVHIAVTEDVSITEVSETVVETSEKPDSEEAVLTRKKSKAIILPYDADKVKAAIAAYDRIYIVNPIITGVETKFDIKDIYNDLMYKTYSDFTKKYAISTPFAVEMKHRYGLLPLNPNGITRSKKRPIDDGELLEEYILPLQQRKIKLHKSVINYVTEKQMKTTFVGSLNDTYDDYAKITKKAKMELIPLNSFCNNLSYFGVMRTGASLVGTGCDINK